MGCTEKNVDQYIYDVQNSNSIGQFNGELSNVEGIIIHYSLIQIRSIEINTY